VEDGGSVATRDGSRSVHVVAIGASAGGIEALRNLVGALPESFPAAVLVVLHLPTHGTSVLPQILARAGELPAVQATDGLVLEGGKIYVAPPDCHLLVENGAICLDHGPRINGHRPAVDPLFRSVAATYGPSGAGVVLSGVLDDGTAGLMAIKQAGGVTLVQDPAEALYDTMPRTASELVSPDHIGTAEQLGRVLAEIATPLPPDLPKAAERGNEEHLVEVDRGSSDSPQPGTVTGLTCPECNGAIWLDESQAIPRFACRTGHAFSIESFAAAQTERVEAALWTALRTLEERAALYRRMAARQREGGNARISERWALRAESAVQHAFVLREVIEQFDGAREAGAA
jgi:two-component system, chemotaxis family, protein-glutamate methylesterase/glutaminase